MTRWFKHWLERRKEISRFNIMLRVCLSDNKEKEFWEYMISYSENKLNGLKEEIK